MRLIANRRSVSETMLYRANMDCVLWPLTSIATFSPTPARIMFLTAVRRRSWKSRRIPVSLQAVSQALRMSPMGKPLRWKMSEASTVTPSARSNDPHRFLSSPPADG